ncbi:MAG: DNA translocase FtsK [Clostridia bacterium]|nr:DNA translocase FtsK [Clostridia bacterium]
MTEEKNKKGGVGKTSSRVRSEKQKRVSDGPAQTGRRTVKILLTALAILVAVCLTFPRNVGLLGYGIAMGFCGLFGVAAFLVPVLLIQIAFFRKKDVIPGAALYQYLAALGFLILSAVIVHTFRELSLQTEYTFTGIFAGENLKSLFQIGGAYRGGGFIGGVLALTLICVFGAPCTLIVGFLLLAVSGLALFGLTPKACVRKMRAWGNQMCENTAQASSSLADKAEQDQTQVVSVEAQNAEKGNDAEPIAYTDVPADEDAAPAEVGGQDEAFGETAASVALAESAEAETEYQTESEEADGLRAQEEQPVSEKDDAAPEAKPEQADCKNPTETAWTDEDGGEESAGSAEYEFPSLTLLHPAEKLRDDEGEEQMLRENADKIVETLENFHVHVSISHVSKGPTVTRYELEPAPGTRVRSIINLLDDIALSLATGGVRSDGIITGKSAIGIEVPNQTVNTVYIRELIENEYFTEAKSRLTTCLGMDVSGAPVYLDIAKMPHLLIAGATGMGKSVCINSLLISLLYKARPEEVRLILIDPKKVELNIYNGIPHLLVPVVFDPKKAAGALHWAVAEMERRFELIESRNTRNIAQYNAAIADDPTQEFLPQIVIVIDELADLMMSAPDDVETAVCRLAQKARAAGMHLIIGTQRPSVDVITGLIKANIPSRIAFTVASQIDSRTIIDTQGAEKLIGRGDMLYAPVGAQKPVRVQGSFVSETEIEEIVGFIRSQKYGTVYSDEVMAQITKAAELCGQKKGRNASAWGGEGAEDRDPMLNSAIELAVECGKISTSLIQRRLQLGYGRAAKIIDVMERRGIVSASDGQRARTVLITREQYLEMRMSQSDRIDT